MYLHADGCNEDTTKQVDMTDCPFTTLADVLTVCAQDADDTFSEMGESPLLDVDMTSLEECSDDEFKNLTESDFLNLEAFQRGEEVDSELVSGNQMLSLCHPEDLLVPPMWSEGLAGLAGDRNLPAEVELEVEIISSWEEEREDRTMIDLDDVPSHPSPGSTGEFTDYCSDSGSEPSMGMDLSRSTGHLYPFPTKRIKQEEPFNLTVPASPYPSHEQIKNSVVEPFHPFPNGIKQEFAVKTDYVTYPTPSVLPSVVTSDPVQDSGSESCGDDSDTSNNNNSGSNSNKSKQEKKRPGRRKGQVSKVYHLWEFIRDMLADPKYCPRVIKWENRDEGIFRVVQSELMATMWGQRKNNRTKMTYEKMSRSIRYSRKEGYFADIPKERGYPKKLCFKFGTKSHGWDLAKS